MTRDAALRAVCRELLNYAENYELEHIEWARHARRWAAQIEAALALSDEEGQCKCRPIP